MSEAGALLAAATARLAPLEEQRNQAAWDVACEATDEHASAEEAAAIALEEALADPALHTAAMRAEAVATDSLERRQAHLLRLSTASKQRPADLTEAIVGLETRLGALHSTHRGIVAGERVSQNDIDRILEESPDLDQRQAAWEAQKSIGPHVDGDLRHLARLRNEAARRLGYRDHYALSLEAEEIDEGWLLETFDRLEGQLAVAWAAELDAIRADQRARFGWTGSGPLDPWQMADCFAQEPISPALDALPAAVRTVDPEPPARAYYADLGHDVDGILGRSDLYPRECKSQHAFQITIDRAGDVRTLNNIVPSLRWLSTLLHELGHAVYDESIDPELPWLVRTASHILTTEAIAMLHARRERDPLFLVRYVGIPEDLASDPVNGLVARRNLLVFAHWTQVMVRFERELYRDPDADLATLWWDAVERFQGVRRPPGDRPHDWATKIHLALTPVYYHNYVLGELTASQLEAMLERETGHPSPAAHPKQAGQLLRDRFLRPGASVRWDELIEGVTGAPLGIDAFASAFAR